MSVLQRSAEQRFLYVVFGSEGVPISQEAGRTMLEDCLACLTPREREVIGMRFGMGRHTQSFSLEDIARTYGITRERVRQIENHAIRKLRSSTSDKDPIEVTLDSPISSLNPSTRLRVKCRRMGISTIEHLIARSADDLAESGLPAFPIEEAREKLAQIGQKLKGE